MPTRTSAEKRAGIRNANRLCKCGHAQMMHVGATNNGTCTECYSKSHEGLGDYCNRFRIPKEGK